MSEALTNVACGEVLACGLVGCDGEPQLKEVSKGKVVDASNANIRKMLARSRECDPRADVLSIDCGRKSVVYEQWMAVSDRCWLDQGSAVGGRGQTPLHHYISTGLQTGVRRDTAGFRTYSHSPRAETGRWEGLTRHVCTQL